MTNLRLENVNAFQYFLYNQKLQEQKDIFQHLYRGDNTWYFIELVLQEWPPLYNKLSYIPFFIVFDKL